ncbi:ATP-binding cassette domain-containing protein [Nocardia gipuzkoensis]|uniref:ABC transporter ATP-binding protein n=1 Tax=Nocardia gipuzkoensis TaxID=2749991 RepID=UPI001E2C8761|nr:ATP-binding cassette domain-containing protein [Nocardia gipuzkoensis]UGT68536.1 ATP-binding cassette domain-containing protein [Nocardia gipuzkoensis]
MSLLINDVSFSYGARSVLRGVTWELEQGVTMLLGSNGAGKSTLLGLVATKFALTAGSITDDGRSWSDPSDLEAIRRRIGWVPQALDMDRAMRVRDFVSYCGWLRGMSSRLSVAAASRALERMDLGARANDRIRDLSGGMQRRALIAAGIVHSPSILILDEPTAGLDPKHRHSLNTMIRDYGREGAVVLVSTHISEDTEAADEVGIISDGLLVANDTPADLRATYGSIAQAYMELASDEEDTGAVSA